MSFYAAETLRDIFGIKLKKVRSLLFVESMYALVAQKEKQDYTARLQKIHNRKSQGKSE